MTPAPNAGATHPAEKERSLFASEVEGGNRRWAGGGVWILGEGEEENDPPQSRWGLTTGGENLLEKMGRSGMSDAPPRGARKRSTELTPLPHCPKRWVGRPS